MAELCMQMSVCERLQLVNSLVKENSMGLQTDLEMRGGVAEKVLCDQILQQLQILRLKMECGGKHNRLELIELREEW